MRWRNRAALAAAVLAVAGLAIWSQWRAPTDRAPSRPTTASSRSASTSPARTTSPGLPPQTRIDNAEVVFDSAGVPLLRVPDLGDVRQPATIAAYALWYSGSHYPDGWQVVKKDAAKSAACVRWLVENLKASPGGGRAWNYEFDNAYNDVVSKAPWISAFGQAVGIEALLQSVRDGVPPEHLALAREAAVSLLRPIRDGGLMFQKGDDIWFEEVASPPDNPPHILNGHMRALMALRKLSAATGDKKYQDAFDRGMATLLRWLPLYDAGYWLRYDLNPKKAELLFRLSDPYGYPLSPLAIDRVTLRDPAGGKEVVLDVGGNIDADGPVRIAGNDWGQPEELDGRTVRRLQRVAPPTPQEDGDGQVRAPGTYFYLTSPAEWRDNLRTQELELSVEYKDEARGNLAAQMRSIAPGRAFRDLRDGDLLLTGCGQWRTWRIPLRPSDLGYWVGLSYAQRHAEYLEQLSTTEPRLKPWASAARGYARLAGAPEDYRVASLQPVALPRQTPSLSAYSLDDAGVIRQHIAGPNTRLDGRGFWNGRTEGGPPCYSPFLVSCQALKGSKAFNPVELLPPTVMDSIPAYKAKYRWLTAENLRTLRREAAYEWLAKSGRGLKDGATVWEFGFDNVYNDVFTPAPWPSAFGQNYVLLALMQAVREHRAEPALDYRQMLRRGAEAMRCPLADGGLLFRGRLGAFLEEVPNGTHVLNCQLVTAATLRDVQEVLGEPWVGVLREEALECLRHALWLSDTGYWLRYDANPRKELLLQLDWIEGTQSPLIQEVALVNPQTNTAGRICVGVKGDFDGYPRLSGSDWLVEQEVDGRIVRPFQNGYEQRAQSVAGGARHNVFLFMALPERTVADDFDVPPHQLVLRYKDVAAGRFAVKVQSIRQGNFLEFVPIRGGQLRCSGDGQWKQAVLEIRPQDMGWYVGPDYQVFHVEQLRELGKQTGDWFFTQHAERHEFFLKAQAASQPAVIEPARPTSAPTEATTTRSSRQR